MEVVKTKKKYIGKYTVKNAIIVFDIEMNFLIKQAV